MEPDLKSLTRIRDLAEMVRKPAEQLVAKRKRLTVRAPLRTSPVRAPLRTSPVRAPLRTSSVRAPLRTSS
eukprot:4722930-Pyramimonas_sp.AAC.1